VPRKKREVLVSSRETCTRPSSIHVATCAPNEMLYQDGIAPLEVLDCPVDTR
jgi:hypothetical protein